jgi:hypothetical protein
MRAQADLEGKSLHAVCSRGSFGRDLFLTASRQTYRKKLRQLGDIHRNPSRFILADQLRRRSASRLILK